MDINWLIFATGLAMLILSVTLIVLAVILVRSKGKLSIHIGRYPPSLYKSWDGQWYTYPQKDPVATIENDESEVSQHIPYDGIFKGPDCKVGLASESNKSTRRVSQMSLRPFKPRDSLPAADDLDFGSARDTGYLNDIMTTRYLLLADSSVDYDEENSHV